MHILLKKNFLSPEECEVLNAWVDKGVAEKWLDAGIIDQSGLANPNRVTTRSYGDRFEYPAEVHQTFQRITDLLGLHDFQKSTFGGGRDGVVVNCVFPGGDVYPHIDPMEGSLHLLRCNVMTRAADAGAELFIGGNKIDIGVGDLHCYLPSRVKHYVTTAEGNTSRVLWMFGYQMSEEDFLQLSV